MKRILAVAAVTLLTMFVAPVAADEQEEIRVHLVGYQETPMTINTTGALFSGQRFTAMARPSTMS